MYEVDETPYLPRQLDAAIRVPDRDGAAAPCVTSGIGHDGLMVRGAPRLQNGCEVELTLFGDHREELMIHCVAAGQHGPDLLLTYDNLAFHQRVHLEEMARPHWDGIDVLDGLMTMACLYGPSSLKDWLCMTNLLERIQPHILHRHGTCA